MVKMLKSRTFWAIVAMFVIGGVNAVHDFIPAAWLPVVQGAFGIAAVYFKLKPSQDYR